MTDQTETTSPEPKKVRFFCGQCKTEVPFELWMKKECPHCGLIRKHELSDKAS